MSKLDKIDNFYKINSLYLMNQIHQSDLIESTNFHFRDYNLDKFSFQKGIVCTFELLKWKSFLLITIHF